MNISILMKPERNTAPFGFTMNHEAVFSSLRLGYVDDKNCLAELTVVLKLNHGAGNGCKSLPVCFSFVLSFAQAKESTYMKKPLVTFFSLS